ncbi:MAG: hypothetical protein K8S99_11395 [Planctomycetes bacterium]|nr:hypothetical protein [Planctomycetota bacterium]
MPRVLRILPLTAALLLLAACAPSRSTRMTVSDWEVMGSAMAASLAQSPAITRRTPASEPWVVSIDKVQNLTSDVMTEGEQWGIIARLRGTLPMRALKDQKNIAFVIPPEQMKKVQQSGAAAGVDGQFGERRKPTHLMTATFRSVTRAQAERRTELYYAEFELLDIHDGVPVWTDRFEYKREAVGHVWD